MSDAVLHTGLFASRIERDHRARMSGYHQACMRSSHYANLYAAPEVDIVKRDLERAIVGLSISNVEVASLKCLRSYFFRQYFTSRLLAAKVQTVGRVGLYITVHLDTALTLVIYLGASGLPRRLESSELPEDAVLREDTQGTLAQDDPAHGTLANVEVKITFSDDNGYLCFVDSEGTGQMFLVPSDSIETYIPDTANYGHDPLTPITWHYVAKQVLQSTKPLKTILTSDNFMVGIGSIYADEILFDAGLRYDRSGNTLAIPQIRRLHRSIGIVLHDAIKHGGLSLDGRPFIHPSGREGAYSSHMKVWGRDGERSGTSRVPIQKVMYNGDWTYYCSTQV